MAEAPDTRAEGQEANTAFSFQQYGCPGKVTYQIKEKKKDKKDKDNHSRGERGNSAQQSGG